MKTADIKTEIFRQVDTLDPLKLQEFYGVMLNFINSKRDIDEWTGVNEREIKGIEAAIEELDSGKGIPHSQVMTKLRNIYSHV